MKTWEYRSLKLGLQLHLLEFRRIIQNSQEPCSCGTCLVVFDMSVFREYHETFVPLDLPWLQFDLDLMPLSLPVKLKHRRQTTGRISSSVSCYHICLPPAEARRPYFSTYPFSRCSCVAIFLHDFVVSTDYRSACLAMLSSLRLTLSPIVFFLLKSSDNNGLIW